jgi:hypothetical protein
MSKQAKVFTIKVERGSFYRNSSSDLVTGTLEELIKYFSYTLEVGASWQYERGNKKINRNPKTIASLVSNLYNAKNNAAANGYSGYSFSVVENPEAVTA